MACEYFVGGKWVTESQFKEILNNGLLDNLVANGDISLKGYKPDSSKVIKRETKTITKDTIPANKLANILAKEIKTRAGYPINMLSALELNAAGTDFKIPLWASPYATKFESLLTSLVSNKVVKQKLPGTSSVLGSEEGFRVKEGDATAGDLKNSGIVFTDSFDPVKGLQPMRIDPKTNKILPDQVIMPFKFRAESGEILNIDEFTIVTEEGRKMLDTTKLPKELLQNFGFRIPTQKQNSMAGIEIVGFLPEAMGDLLLAPRDFTRRMGSDFDVDKLYQYFYNVFYQNGKLHNNFLSDPKAIEKAREATEAQIEELKDSLKFTKEERKLVDDYIKDNLQRTEENEEPETVQKINDLIKRSISQVDRQALEDAFTRLSVLNRSYVAARQNNIIKTHLRIANSSNPEVIKMFLGTDSSGEYKDLAEKVNAVRMERGLVPPIITILSDTYQRTKYVNATAGKNAVGGFSLDSTFNATAQGKDLVIINLTPGTEADVYGTLENPRTPTKEDFLIYNAPIAIFGDTESKGDLSNKYTLRSQAIINKAKQEKRELTDAEKKSLKYKSEVIKTLQSSALDNEKEQILDKLNINDQTFDAIRALGLLGFEEKDIAGLLSQEIIWEYVAALQDANSSLTAYNPNAEEDTVNFLISKYDPQNKFRGLAQDMVAKYQSQSGQELMDNIANETLKPLTSGETPDFNLRQLALLQKFRELSAHGKTIKQLQSTINTESKGLPKSLIEVNAKVEQISKLPLIDVFNADKLLGKYSGNQLVQPEGINGYAAYYGTLFADKIFNNYFPYKTQGFQTAVGEILTHTPKGADVSINKKAEVQAEVFEEVRSYLYGNPGTNLFSGDPTLERKRLFVDSTDNQSLATILNTLSNQSWFQKNGFLNKLSFDLNKNGQISRINFEAAAGENFDERNIYDGFVYLLTKNFPVGTFNGIEYTSRTLAQELIAAAFLEGGTQGAKQYLKYVPISYLKVLGFGEYLQKVPFDFISTFYGNLSDYGPIYNQPSSFTRQYFQNNPDKVKTVSLSDLKGTNTSTPKDYFTLTPEALLDNFVDVIDPVTGDSTQMQTQFLSIYDTKEPSKYALYEFDSVDRNYKRIPVLSGSYGFVAYNSTTTQALPIESGNIKSTTKIEIQAPGYTVTNIPVQPTKEFDINVVNNTTPVDLVVGLPISKSFSGTKEALDDLFNNLETAEGVSTLNKQLMMLFRDLQLPEKFKVNYVYKGKGAYDYDSNTLFLNLNHKEHLTPNDLATTVLHELTHTFTGEAIKRYERGDTDLSPNQIAAIQKLEKLQALYISNLTEQGETGSLAAFKAKYEAYAASDKTKSPDISKEEISKYYGAIKLSEFVTMALTDVEFQKRLNDIKTEDGKTLWEQIKDVLFNLLNTLGLDIKPGSALATSVKDTFDLIEANQEALKADNITTEAFMEHGTKYKFQVNGNGEVIKAEYAQGMSMVYNPMNAKNAQKKYDSLKAGIETWKLFGDKPGQPAQPNVSTTNNPAEYTNHSGGAALSDTEWDQIGREFGVNSHKHYREPLEYIDTKGQSAKGSETLDSKKLQAAGIKPEYISQEDYNEGAQKATKAFRMMFTDAGNKSVRSAYIIRNWMQVKNADAIYALGTIKQPGENASDKASETRIAAVPIVKGGTGYAVQMAINEGKPVYVFDGSKEGWYTYDYKIKNFVPTETPTLTKNFAGIGSRSLSTQEVIDKSLQAIRDVYANTFKAITQPTVTSIELIPKNEYTITSYTNEPKKGTYHDILRTGKKPLEYKVIDVSDKGVLVRNEETQKEKLFTKDEYFKTFNISEDAGFSVLGEFGLAEVYRYTELQNGQPVYSLEINLYDESNEGKGLGKDIYKAAIQEIIKRNGVLTPGNVVEGNKIWESFKRDNLLTEEITKDGDKIIVIGNLATQPTVEPTQSMFKIVGTDVVFAEDGSTAQEYNTLEEAQEGLKKWQATEKEEPKTNKFEYEGKSIDTAFPLTNGQKEALESLIDFVKQDDEKVITLQGAAGTGKTAVIGYLQKYFKNTGTTFAYMAPTHAATAELAFATVKSGNKELPMTVQSAVSDRIDPKTGTRNIAFNKKLTSKLGFGNNIIVVDESSMLSAKDYQALNIAIKNKDIKIVFMGDILQIPEVDVANPEQKQVSLAFTEPRQLNLSEVKRTESDAILEVLTALRNNTTPSIPTIPNTEEIKYLSGKDYNRELIETVKEDPEDTLVISYTNAGVADTNTKIRKLLGREGDLQSGDIIVGYLGYSSKQVEKGNIANSIRYTVDDVQKEGSKYLITASSKKLGVLQEAGVKVSPKATGYYLQLDNNDSFKFEDLTQEDFNKNNREISDKMKMLYEAKKAAIAQPRLWPEYYSKQGEVANYFAENSVGGNYIYNPSTDRMERFNSMTHGQLKRSFPELYVEKGIDFGHAVTIHKSQGSTVKNVFFDASTLPQGSSSKLFQGNRQVGNEKHSLIYVAMSRASNKLVVNSEQKQHFYPLRGEKLNLSKLQNLEETKNMPIQGDMDEYYKNIGPDESLETSPINPKELEKYLLICGK